MKKNLNLFFIGAIILFFFVACIKDTDFDQAEDIALTPILEVDFIYFNIDAGQFFDEMSSTEILTIRDTTEIRILNDTEIQESLIRAEFFYRFNNSIPRNFLVDIRFLSEDNDTTYTTQISVIQGSLQMLIVTEFIQNVEGDDIIDLTQSDKVVVSVTIPSSNANLEGILNLQSKTTYYLEF